MLLILIGVLGGAEWDLGEIVSWRKVIIPLLASSLSSCEPLFLSGVPLVDCFFVVDLSTIDSDLLANSGLSFINLGILCLVQPFKFSVMLLITSEIIAVFTFSLITVFILCLVDGCCFRVNKLQINLYLYGGNSYFGVEDRIRFKLDSKS